MNTEYTKQHLMHEIIDLFKIDSLNQCQKLYDLFDKQINKLELKMDKLTELVVFLQDEGLLITYDCKTNIIEEGNDENVTLWIDTSINIEDVDLFVEFLRKHADVDKLTSQDDIENFLNDYLEVQDNRLSFNEIGLVVSDYNVQ